MHTQLLHCLEYLGCITLETGFPTVKERYQCTGCDSQFKSVAGVSFHLAAVHEGLKPLICSDCNYNAKKVNQLNDHIKQVHEGIKMNECEFCHKTFTARTTLKSHIDKIHKQKLPFQCTECFARFAINCTLQSHIESVHQGLKPFKCEFCDKSFSLKGNMNQHIKKVHHEPKEQAECLICNPKRILPTANHLARHHKTVHEQGRPYECYTCGIGFMHKYELTKHIKKIHEKAKIRKTVSCNDCGARFNHKGSLKKHMEAKGKKTREQIQMEQEAANAAEDMEYTLEDLLVDQPGTVQPGRVHEEEKHICPFCEITVISPTYLKNHIATMHPL